MLNARLASYNFDILSDLVLRISCCLTVKQCALKNLTKACTISSPGGYLMPVDYATFNYSQSTVRIWYRGSTDESCTENRHTATYRSTCYALAVVKYCIVQVMFESFSRIHTSGTDCSYLLQNTAQSLLYIQLFLHRNLPAPSPPNQVFCLR
jgi:hypothetical protein